MTAAPLGRCCPPRRLLRAALAAAGAGLHVFPVRPGSKIPAVRDWEHAATIDPDAITAWWRTLPYNIGVATGPSGLAVVDLDIARGATPPPRLAGARGGEDVLRALAADAGQPYPGDTFTVATPTGGTHLYFRQPDGTALRDATGRLGWKIDTRGHGGYVIAAGSTRREGRYHITHRRPIAPLPAWLAVALTPRTLSPAVAESLSRPVWCADTYLRAILDAETDAVAAARPGTRHTTLLAAATTLGRLVAGGELTPRDARSALHRAADRHVGVDGMTAIEITSTIADGLRYGHRRPRYLREP